MKVTLVSLFVAAGLIAAGAANAADETALATSKGCLACHDVNATKVGPAYKAVAKKYTAKDSAALVKSVLEGSSGKWKEANGAAMPPNKMMGVTEADAKKLVAWVLSLK